MWLNKTSRFLLIIAVFFFTLLLGSIKCFALEVTCQNSGCTLNPDHTPLFSESNVLPLWSTTKTITANNLYLETRTFAFEIKKDTFGDSLSDPLADVLRMTVKEIESGITLYGPLKLSDAKNVGWILLSNIPAGATRNYDVTVKMDDVGNTYQNKNVRFDMNVGFDTSSHDEGDGGGDEDENGGGTGGGFGITSAVAGIAAQFGFGGPLQTFEEVAGTAAPATPEPETVLSEDEGAGKVKGVSACVDPKFWWVLFIIQFLLCYLFYKRVNKQNIDKKKWHSFIQILNDLVFMFIFWRYFCPWWDVLVSALIGVFWLTLLRRKIDKLHGYSHLQFQ